MLESWLRQYFQHYAVNPIAKAAVTVGFTANQITILSLVVGVAGGLSIPWNSELAVMLLVLSGYLDMLDGSVARIRNTSSPFGAMLDITCDRMVEWAVVVGLFKVEPNERGINCLLMLGSILIVCTSFLLTGIFTKNQSSKSFNYSPDLMERAEAFIFFVAMILCPKQFNILANLFTFLVLVTAANRFWKTVANLPSEA